MKDATAAIRLQNTRSGFKEHSVPVYLTSSYAFDSAEEAEGLFAGTLEGPIYSRYNNPNTDELVRKVSYLERADDGLACASGMSSIFSAITGLLSQGDHLVAAKAVFGSTLGLLENILPRFGITTTFVDLKDNNAWERAITPATKAFFAETPTNPGLELADLEHLAALARSRGILLMVDNCFATPWNQKPMVLGADLVCHSTTKFMDGQGRSLGGIIVGKQALIDTIRPFVRATGPAMSPFNAWIVSKSLETLHVRMERHCRNAEDLARWLQGYSDRVTVRYPGLENHPQYTLAKKQMKTGGALLSIDLGSSAKAVDFINRLRILSRSANLGDTRSIVTHPATTTHAKVAPALKAELGITDGMVRISVGLEDFDDIQADIAGALGLG